MVSDGYRRGYVSFAHFLLYFLLLYQRLLICFKRKSTNLNFNPRIFTIIGMCNCFQFSFVVAICYKCIVISNLFIKCYRRQTLVLIALMLNLATHKHYYLCLSCIMRKTAFCISENKGADQLFGNRTADKCLSFCYI